MVRTIIPLNFEVKLSHLQPVKVTVCAYEILRVYLCCMFELCFQILGDVCGNLDAKKALNEALKVHRKYLRKASSIYLFPL